MASFQVKPGVILTPATAALDHLLQGVQAACDEFSYALTVTSGRDSHGPDDSHTHGRAIDIRANGLASAFVPVVYGYLKGWLGPLFYVQYEVPAPLLDTDPLHAIAVVSPGATAPHFHCQVRIGLDYPPVPHAILNV